MILDELYKLAEHGVSRAHIECLIWFRENEGKVVDNDALRGKRVPGATDDGYPYSARKPIPADRIVSEPHYLHAGIRGWYKPKGEKIVGYDKENRKPIWEGSDDFVQALQTGTGESLEEYGKEVEFDANRKWTVINYDHNGPASRYYEITGGYIQRCYENNIPIGIVFKEGENQNKILGLGLITKVSKNKLEYKIEPYKMSQQSTFSFVEKDFKSLTSKSEDGKYRHKRFKELLKALENNLSSSFADSGHVIGRWNYPKSSKAYENSWLAKYFGKKAKDTVQFKVSLNKIDPVHTGLYIGKQAKVTHKNIAELIKERKRECFKILSNLPSTYSIFVRNKKDGIEEEFIVPNLKMETMDFIVKAISTKETNWFVGRFFDKPEAIGMGTDIIKEFSDTFEELLPLHRFLTGQNNEQITNDLDKKLEDWLKRGARKYDKSIEDYARDLGKEEYESRYETFPKLKAVLEKEPIDLDGISAVSKITTCIGDGKFYFGEHWTNRLLVKFLRNERAKEAVRALVGYKNETDMSTFIEIVREIMPAEREPTGKSERRVGIDPAQILVIAGVFLTALYPDKFVDFRESRWKSLAKQIGIEEEFASVKGCTTAAKPEEIGKFAKKITETSTFKKYWGNQSQPLWTLAGICYSVKDSNATPGTATSMDVDEMIDEILKMDYDLAIDRNVVRRIILHLLSGKNVVLVGAPGVGKTALAKRILDVVGRKMTGLNYEQAVATAEWTKRDIIGGLDLEQKFQKGKVTEAAEQGKWLLIDEFNRADINKAFGEMFLAIESKRIPLSEELAEAYALVSKPKGQHSITIPKNFRMVCTMNDFDKNLLLTELSFGLITRFAFVDIEPDTDKEQESVKNQVLDRFIESDIEVDEHDYDSCKEQIEAYFGFINVVRDVRMIGVRTSIDVIAYFVYASKANPNEAWSHLDEALCDYLSPQIDRLRKDVIDKVKSAAESKLTDAKRFTKWLDDRLEELEKISGFLGS